MVGHERNPMSKQLTLSITLSVLAMTAFALLGSDASGWPGTDGALRLPISAQAPALPDIGQILPTIQ